MATRYGNFLKGIIGSLIFKQRKGKQVVSERSAPGTIKHTAATKRASSTFGMATTLNSHIRQMFALPIGGFGDAEMVNRLNSKMIQILNLCRNPDTLLFQFDEDSFSNLAGFDYNVNSPLAKSLGSAPSYGFVNGILNLKLPSLAKPSKLKFPARSTGCEITASAALFLLEEGMKVYRPADQKMIVQKVSADLDGFDFQFEVPEGCFGVVSIFLNYYSIKSGREVIINHKGFSPAGIAAAVFHAGKYVNNNGQSWVPMNDLHFNQ